MVETGSWAEALARNYEHRLQLDSLSSGAFPRLCTCCELNRREWGGGDEDQGDFPTAGGWRVWDSGDYTATAGGLRAKAEGRWKLVHIPYILNARIEKVDESQSCMLSE